MTKLLFTPFSVIGGILAGVIAKKIFEALWGLFDEHEPPGPEHRGIPIPKLVAALVLEGAIFRAVRGLGDHGTRWGFQKLTGSWPGEEHPKKS